MSRLPKKPLSFSFSSDSDLSDSDSSEDDEHSSESENDIKEPPEYIFYTNKNGKSIKRRKPVKKEGKTKTLNKKEEKKHIIFEEDDKELNEWELDIPLYTHQQNSVLRMEYQEDNPSKTVEYSDRYNGRIKCVMNSHIGILSDKVGSGKTLTTISFLARRKKKEEFREEEYKTSSDEDINKIYLKNNMKFINIEESQSTSNKPWFSFTKYYLSTYFYLNPNLVVIGASVYNQWIAELKHSNLTYKVIYKNADFYDIDKWIDCVDIILITYNRYNDLWREINKYIAIISIKNGLNSLNFDGICFKRLIFDEVQVYGKLNSLYALNYWIVSATVYCSNDMQQYGSRNGRSTNMMADLLNGTLGNFVNVKNSPEEMEQSYRQAEMIQHYYHCYVRDLNNLMSHLTPEVQRMIAADDIGGAISALGGTKDSKSITDIVIEKEEKSIKELKASIVYYQTIENDERIKEVKEKLEKAEQSLKNLKEKLEESEKEDCPICCCSFEGIDKVLTDCCKYIVCCDCINKLYKTTKKCPFCRASIDLAKLTVSSSKEDIKEGVNDKKVEIQLAKPKTETVIDIIKSKPNGKFLLFSEYSSTFDNTIRELDRNRISWKEVKGTTDTKQKAIRDFKNGLVKVLFLNARHDGTGINLPETTDIILYHQLSSSAIETQIFGRALRLGRTAPLVVHRLLSQAERRIVSNDPAQLIHVHAQQIQEEEEEDDRTVQEREDRELAIQLQRELNMN